MESMIKSTNIGGGGGGVDMDVDEELEIRPGGMLVQNRKNNNSDSNQSSASITTIKVRVKYGSTYHQIFISSHASFGELKKMLTEPTGLHHEDQKLIYKKKERSSKEYLDVARVKDGSKMVLIEDVASRERRCLEMIKIANLEKATKSLTQIRLEVDNFVDQVKVLEAKVSRGERVMEAAIDNLIGMLMTKLVALDEIVVGGGDLKLQKKMQEKRVQNYIETLDVLKLHNPSPLQHSTGKKPIPPTPLQKQQIQSKRRNFTGKRHEMKQQPLMAIPESDAAAAAMVTTKWETFD